MTNVTVEPSPSTGTVTAMNDNMETTLNLSIDVDPVRADEVFDALNEVLNTLALDGVLDDSDDHAWAWS